MFLTPWLDSQNTLLTFFITTFSFISVSSQEQNTPYAPFPIRLMGHVLGINLEQSMPHCETTLLASWVQIQNNLKKTLFVWSTTLSGFIHHRHRHRHHRHCWSLSFLIWILKLNLERLRIKGSNLTWSQLNERRTGGEGGLCIDSAVRENAICCVSPYLEGGACIRIGE